MKIQVRSAARAAVVAAATLLLLLANVAAEAATRDVHKCRTGVLQKPLPADYGDDLVVDVPCKVGAGTYRWGNVNVIANGVLEFEDAVIDFWARSILVEKDGAVVAGKDAPIGTNGGVVTIHLYGKDQGAAPFPAPSPGKGIRCLSDAVGMCGVPPELWNSNLEEGVDPHRGFVAPRNARKIGQLKLSPPYPGLAEKPALGEDYFYAYHPLPYDTGDSTGYFGYKVLAVSYGGTLKLSGKKGACTTGCDDPSTTGPSWVRLGKTLNPGEKSLTVSSPVDWKKGDRIVVTTTDYLPGHSEELVVAEDVKNGTTVSLLTPEADASRGRPVKYVHNGERYPLSGVTEGILDPVLAKQGAETRAAVALLSRSIRIVSGGNQLDQELDAPELAGTPDAYFGGHMIARQGFRSVQIQGVEFHQMGQGGRMAHYPIHFHHARRTPKDTFVKDSSIDDSMTRWIVLHGTHDVTLARNVGYKSIGHGFYLEDGSEINNRLLGNIGILARAAVTKQDGTAQRDNPRKVPGILAMADRDPVTGRSVTIERVPFRSDYDHPTVFWIMNGWNDFQYNMAAGATGCGTAYWLVPGYNSGMSREMRWASYASMQAGLGRAAMTPLKSFVGNGAVATQMSFNTVGDTSPCFGIGNPDPLRPDQEKVTPFLEPVPNPLVPTWPTGDPNSPPYKAALAALLDYFPGVDRGGGRFATRCGTGDDETDCSALPPRCSSGETSEPACMVTVLDRFTSSFHWAEFNFAALWLRPQWYLVTDSVVTDVQGGGLNFVTGGGYSASDRVNGHWALVRRSAFIGQTQPETSIFALNGGPFNSKAGALQCAGVNDGNGFATLPGNYCLSVDEGVAFPITSFGMSQRLFSVYDGPAFQESNAYLSIRSRPLDDCTPVVDEKAKTGTCNPVVWTDDQGLKRLQSHWLAGLVQGLPKRVANGGKEAYMPNAAIGWKQPNGFYYPPAFHSSRLYFGEDVEIRHFVLEPVFEPVGPKQPKLFVTDAGSTLVSDRYALYGPQLFKGFTDVDRQTVLNDDDGSLTGYWNTISVNLDPFFNGPREAIECRSDETAKTSPYEHVTTVVYPGCAVDGSCAKDYDTPPIPNPHVGEWDRACSSPGCYGIPLYRQHLTKADAGVAKSIFMMGQSIGQRSSLTVNHGTYFVDTTKARSTQEEAACPANGDCNISVFRAGQVYNLFLVFGKTTTRQTYQIYVGKEAAFSEETDVWMTQADIRFDPITFKKYEGTGAWPSGWERRYDRTTGILKVVIDLGAAPELDRKVKDARAANCRPATFCEWSADGNQGLGSCREKGTESEAICGWAVKDVDCPDGGCFGIGFRLPAEFRTDPGFDPRPAAVCLQTTDPDYKYWNVPLVKVDSSVAGDCPPDPDKLKNDFCDLP